MKKRITKEQIYKKVTGKIIKKMEEGIVPWQKPWTSTSTKRYGDAMFPTNVKTIKEYRGINHIILSPHVSGYNSPIWGTFKQWKEIGGKVRKGEKGTAICFWKPIQIKDRDSKDGEDKKKTIMLSRYYVVFNIEQIEGKYKLPKRLQLKSNKNKKTAKKFNKIKRCEEVKDFYLSSKNAPKLNHDGGNRAFYNPGNDSISLPKKSRFKNTEGYYSTLFHEMVHSTGHFTRLNREFGADVGRYSKEELVAEMGSAFICGVCKISNNKVIKNQAAYIKHWVSQFKKDPSILICTAGKAQAAADLIQGVSFENKE